ncbi:MAG: hypothetical protein WB949_16185 [Candidatus Acidiferrales bacterium]
MSIAIRRFGSILLTSALATASFATAGLARGRAAQQEKKPVVILAEMVNGRIHYKVNSKSARPDILRVLSILEEQRGRDCPVVALVDSRAPFDEIGNIDGIAGKAQLTNIRYFVFSKAGGKMSEAHFGPNIPYSPNPPIE